MGGCCEKVYSYESGVGQRMGDFDCGLDNGVGGRTREFRLNLRAIVVNGESVCWRNRRKVIWSSVKASLTSLTRLAGVTEYRIFGLERYFAMHKFLPILHVENLHLI